MKRSPANTPEKRTESKAITAAIRAMLRPSEASLQEGALKTVRDRRHTPGGQTSRLVDSVMTTFVT